MPSEMHPLLLFELFEDWALNRPFGRQRIFTYLVGFFPIILMSLVVCMIPSCIVLIRRIIRSHE